MNDLTLFCNFKNLKEYRSFVLSTCFVIVIFLRQTIHNVGKTTGNPVKSDLASMADRVRRPTRHSSSLTCVCTWFFTRWTRVHPLWRQVRSDPFQSLSNSMDGWFWMVMRTDRSNFIVHASLARLFSFLFNYHFVNPFSSLIISTTSFNVYVISVFILFLILFYLPIE